MTDAELVARYDEAAKGTKVGTDFTFEELVRRRIGPPDRDHRPSDSGGHRRHAHHARARRGQYVGRAGRPLRQGRVWGTVLTQAARTMRA